MDKTIDTGHNIDNNCNANQRTILLIVLIVTSWYIPLKTDPSRTYITTQPLRPWFAKFTP